MKTKGGRWLPSVGGGSSILRDSSHQTARVGRGESRRPGTGSRRVERVGRHTMSNVSHSHGRS